MKMLLRGIPDCIGRREMKREREREREGGVAFLSLRVVSDILPALFPGMLSCRKII